MSKISKTISRTIIATTAFIFCAPAMADVKAGVDAWGRGDYKGAIQQWRGPADSGDADAQFNMAQAYKLGRGVTADLAQAERYYKKAADQGHIQASDNYGLILFQSNRRQEALPYLRASANRGEPRAQYVLGTGHFNGDFVEKDWIKAYALMTRASAQGLTQATSNLGQMDKYIPLDERRRSIELASQMEQQERRLRAAQVGGLTPIRPATGPIQTAQLPPSQAATPPVITNPGPGATYTPPTTSVPLPPAAVASRPVQASAVGNWRIQLGAFGDENKAKALWNNLENRVSGMRTLQPYLVRAGNITRLQAGPFATRAQANSACGSVKAAGNDCIVKSR